jgi:hypothetical protein
LDGRTARRLLADDEGAQGVGAFNRAADGGGEDAVQRERCRQGCRQRLDAELAKVEALMREWEVGLKKV